jgi:Domain of unknown function (DUF4878)
VRTRILVRVACVLIVLSVLACAGNSPGSAAKGFYKAIGDGKTDEALDLLSEKTVSTIGKDKLSAGIQKATRAALDKGGMADVEITNEQVANEVANVTVVVKYGNGTAETEKVKLVKEASGWRLQPEK